MYLVNFSIIQDALLFFEVIIRKNIFPELF